MIDFDPLAGSASRSHASRRLLIEGGVVLTMDPDVPDQECGDILVEDGRIVAIGVDLADAATLDGTQTFDASGMIVIPGFVDTHRHSWQNQLRMLIPDADLVGYRAATHFLFGPLYTPHDMYVGGLVSALGALNGGVTTMLDWSHNSRTPEHSDAAIQALADSGMRAVYCFGAPRDADCQHRHPHDLDRIQAEYFTTSDQLLTLAVGMSVSPLHDKPYRRGTDRGPLGPQPDIAEVMRYAHRRGVRTSIDGVHGLFFKEGDYASPAILRLRDAGVLGDDVTFVHCNGLSEEAWTAIAASGCTVSVAAVSEMQLGLATSVPATQDALDHGIRPSLSIDVEIALSGDFFSLMRAVLLSQRSELYRREYAGEEIDSVPVTVRDVLDFATLQGAKANGLSDVTGSLAVGKKADIVCVRVDPIDAIPLNNAYGTVVLRSDVGDVDSVFVEGRAVKYAGNLLDVDLGKIRDLVTESRDDLIERSGYDHSLLKMTLPPNGESWGR